MSEEKCPNTNLEELQTDCAPLTVSRLLFPKPVANLDLKNYAVQPQHDLVQQTRKPVANLDLKNDAAQPQHDLVQQTPKPGANLDLKNDAAQPQHDLVQQTPKPGAKLDLKNDAVPPQLNLVQQTPKSGANVLSLNLNHREQVPGIQSGQVPNINNGMQSLSMNSGRNVARISCANLQVGSNNVMHISSTSKKDRPKNVDEKKLKNFLQSTKKLTKDDFPKLSKIFRKDWKFVGRNLGLNDHELFAIGHDYAVEGFKEICYQMLCCWHTKDPSQCTVGNLAKALKKNDDTDLILQLPLGE